MASIQLKRAQKFEDDGVPFMVLPANDPLARKAARSYAQWVRGSDPPPSVLERLDACVELMELWIAERKAAAEDTSNMDPDV